MAATQEPRSSAVPWKSQVDRRYETLLERLSVKDRALITKHDEASEADAAQGFGTLWKRLVACLGTLAPHATEMSGQYAAKFHIPDGKYRQQVFALEDNKLGMIIVYLPDIVELAIKKKILAPAVAAGRVYKVQGDATGQIQLDLVTAETRDMTVCKAMVGWGRRALRVDLPVLANEKQIGVVESLCELAAESFAAQSTPAPTAKQA
ncbi:MAG TPA: hypothetical protein VGN88_01650 [Phycisphaerae bacterium]|jgi:hypothetical protein